MNSDGLCLDTERMDQLARKTVSYFYDEEYANHSLGGSNPMRPHRVRLTNRLLEGYNLTQRMRVHRPRALDYEHLNYFHADGACFQSMCTPQMLNFGVCISIMCSRVLIPTICAQKTLSLKNMS